MNLAEKTILQYKIQKVLTLLKNNHIKDDLYNTIYHKKSSSSLIENLDELYLEILYLIYNNECLKRELNNEDEECV